VVRIHHCPLCWFDDIGFAVLTIKEQHIRLSSNQFRGSSSVDRALAFQAEGRGFESRLPLQILPM
jgi:hypothetical protein